MPRHGTTPKSALRLRRALRAFMGLLAVGGLLAVSGAAGASVEALRPALVLPASELTIAHYVPFLVCLRAHESGAGGFPFELGYGYATGNGHFGAYQYSPGLWPAAAGTAGYPYLAGVTANRVSVRYQDLVTIRYATWYYHLRGRTPWSPDGCDRLLR